MIIHFKSLLHLVNSFGRDYGKCLTIRLLLSPNFLFYTTLCGQNQMTKTVAIAPIVCKPPLPLSY